MMQITLCLYIDRIICAVLFHLSIYCYICLDYTVMYNILKTIMIF